jgi:hypothetical protein
MENAALDFDDLGALPVAKLMDNNATPSLTLYTEIYENTCLV